MRRILDFLKALWGFLFGVQPKAGLSDEEEEEAERLGRMW